MVAIEIEGIIRLGTCHPLLARSLTGAEKYEAAMMLGWTVYRIPGPRIATPKLHIWRPEVMECVKTMLEFGQTARRALGKAE